MHDLYGGVITGMKWWCAVIVSPASLEQTTREAWRLSEQTHALRAGLLDLGVWYKCRGK